MAIELKEKMTLDEILEAFKALDEGMIELSLDEIKELSEKAEIKVDNYKYFMEKCDAETERLAVRIKQFQAAKRHIENVKDRLNKIMIFSMKSKGFQGLKGEDFKVKLFKRESINWKIDKPDAALAFKFSDFTRAKYEWDKIALTQKIKSGDEFFKEIGEVVETEYLKFSVNKGGINESIGDETERTAVDDSETNGTIQGTNS